MSGVEARYRIYQLAILFTALKRVNCLLRFLVYFFFEKTGAFPSYRQEKQAGDNFIELNFDVTHALNTSYEIKMRLTSMSSVCTRRKKRNYRFLDQTTASCGQLYLVVKSFLLSPVVIKRRGKGNPPLDRKSVV